MPSRIKLPKRLRLIKGRYFWRPTKAVRALGFRNTPLGSDLAEAVALAQRQNERVAAARLGRPASPVAGTVAAVIRDYSKDETFTGKAEATRKGYRQVLTAIERDHGTTAMASITRKELVDLLKEIGRDRGLRTAREFRKLWSILLSFAQNAGLRPDNPILGYRQPKPAARRQVWSPDQVAAVCEAARAAGKPSVALAVLLAYWTSQRLTDVLVMPWTAIAGNAIRLTQSKGGAVVAIPIAPDLRRELQRARQVAQKAKRESGPVVVNDVTGAPYIMTTFNHDFAAARAAAGVSKDLWFRDLRRTALTEASSGGATVPQMRAMSGHKTVSQLSDYVVPTTEAAAGAMRARNKGRSKVAKEGRRKVATRKAR